MISIADAIKCEHSNTDWSWSRGNLERCLDCGSIRDNGVWRSVVLDLALLATCENDPVAGMIFYHFSQVAEIGRKKYGIQYPEYTKEEYKRIGEAYMKAVDEMGGK